MANNNDIKLIIKTHSGDEYDAVVGEYNPVEISEYINESNNSTIAIGDHVLSCVDIKSITKISEG